MLVLSVALVAALCSVGILYAAWRNEASNTGNTVKMGDAVTISLDKEDGTKYFAAEGLYDGAVTAGSAITITANAAYVLKVTSFTIGGEDVPTGYTVDDGLYLEIADNSEFTSATKVLFENAAEITSGSAGKTVYVRIGLGAAATDDWAGRTVTFAIGTSAT